jgi:cathepsin L
MKFVLALLVASLGLALAVENLDLAQKWNQYKLEHSKVYKNHDEEHYRLQVWKSNMDLIEKHNADADKGLKTFWLKMNKFGDLTVSEFASIYNGYNETLKLSFGIKPTKTFEYDPNLQVPDSVDWRKQGFVTDVKDQGQCGSCWAFSSTGSLEGQHFRATGKLVSLSEQNLVDCSTKYGNQGCNGGLMDQAFTYIKANNGIDTEDSYPYAAVDQTCSFNPANVGATDTGFTDVKSKDEDALKQAVGTVGPVSVAIDASHASFQLYSHGIYHEPLCSSTRLDHGVLAVGYDSQGQNKDYWIVKNSWSASWGNQGYIWMSRNKKNNCGISTSASYPNV